MTGKPSARFELDERGRTLVFDREGLSRQARSTEEAWALVRPPPRIRHFELVGVGIDSGDGSILDNRARDHHGRRPDNRHAGPINPELRHAAEHEAQVGRGKDDERN